ncbi:biotin/lipoyl-containing protein [Sphingobacterium sp. E70]|uniref:biotin/lipoyl-containing protein n=1 Tax=Sphingobacterium sp. E70 TaxID=2853439 RepID=UPI00359C5374
MGESVSEATITKWLKQPGDLIEEDDTLLEIATDKVDSEVPSPVRGVLKEQLYTADQIVQVGDVVAIIEIEGDTETSEPTVQSPESIVDQPAFSSETTNLEIPGIAQLGNPVEETTNKHYEQGVRFLFAASKKHRAS